MQPSKMPLPTLVAISTTPTIAPYAKAYLGYLMPGAPFLIASLVLNNQLRFQGSLKASLSPAAEVIKEEIHAKITETLTVVAERGDFVASIYEGLLGSQEDGLYSGRVGAGSVRLE